MLKNTTKIIAFFLVLFLLFSTAVFAENGIDTNVINETSSSDVAPTEETYKKSDVYLGGDNVTIDYIVDGNAFICADTVTINSQIGGDAFIMAKKIIVEEKGYIFSNLFAMAESIEIKGVVYDVYALCQNLNISNGYVYRDIKAACNTLNINASVGRNVFVNCANINFNTFEGANGVIFGNLDYSSDFEISIPENVVNGEVSFTQTSVSTEQPIGEIIADYILDLGTFIAFVLLVWLICLWLSPKFLNNTNQYVGKNSLRVLGIGVLTLITIPVICIALIFLQLTSSFAITLLGLYILALIVSTSLFTITANNYVCSKLKINKNLGILGMLILSAIIVWALTSIPYAGAVISFVITILGLGILVSSIVPKREPKHETTVTE